MLRVLIICWVLGGVLVGALRSRASGGLRIHTLRTDIAAALMVGGLLWLVWLVRF